MKHLQNVIAQMDGNKDDEFEKDQKRIMSLANELGDALTEFYDRWARDPGHLDLTEELIRDVAEGFTDFSEVFGD